MALDGTQSGNGGWVVAIRVGDLVDAGDVIEEWPIRIEPAWNEAIIRDQHFEVAYRLLDRLLGRLSSLSIDQFRPQDLRYRTYYDRVGLVEHKSGPLVRKIETTSVF